VIGSENDGGRHRAANRDNGSSVIPSVVMTPGFTALRRRVAIGGLVLLVCMSACSSPAGAREVNDSPTAYVTQLADTALTPGGWSPPGLGTIQISVPSGWFVEDRGTICGGGPGRATSWLDTDRMGHCCGRARGRSSRDFAPAAARWSGWQEPHGSSLKPSVGATPSASRHTWPPSGLIKLLRCKAILSDNVASVVCVRTMREYTTRACEEGR
jgi:hypothetical protein